MIKKFLVNKMLKAFDDNEYFIRNHINNYCNKKNVNILDVGCGDGSMTMKFLNGLRGEDYELYGLDNLEKNDNKLIKYKKINLDGEIFPFADNFFDIVYSNQVLEHILNKDNFIFECNRTLKNGGLFILSTENISSFDNIISLILGQEPVSQHTGSKYNTNSFLSPHFMEKNDDKNGNKYLHKNVCSYYGLKRLAKMNGFSETKIKSFGNICKLAEMILPIYNRLITIYGIKD
ncbi:MAG: class I SAM-dependent methyltransferase [Patescibacteria group bacterium]